MLWFKFGAPKYKYLQKLPEAAWRVRGIESDDKDAKAKMLNGTNA